MSHRGMAKESIHTFPHFTDKETEVTWPTTARPKAVSPFLLKKKKIVYLFMAVLRLSYCPDLSLVTLNGGYFPVAVRRLLLLQSTSSRAHGLQQLRLPGSRAQPQ